MSTDYVKLPPALLVAEEIRRAQWYCSPEHNDNCVDIRLQLSGCGRWHLHVGDASFDLDHRGHWGSSSVSGSDGIEEFLQIAYDLISQCSDDAFECGVKVLDSEGVSTDV
jgi:hypothetical protein